MALEGFVSVCDIAGGARNATRAATVMAVTYLPAAWLSTRRSSHLHRVGLAMVILSRLWLGAGLVVGVLLEEP